MTEEDGELTVAQRLGRLLDRGLLPAGGPAEAAERLIDRLERPARVALLGLPGAGKSSVLNLLAGTVVVPETLRLPTIIAQHGPVPRMLCTLADGKVEEVGGTDLEKVLVLNPALVTLEMDLPSLNVISLLEVSAGPMEVEQRRAAIWASKRADILIWCTTSYLPKEQSVWEGMPDSVKDNGFLFLTKVDLLGSPDAARGMLERVEQRAGEEFRQVLSISAKQARAAMPAGKAVDWDLFRNSGAAAVISTIKTRVQMARRADTDMAELLLARHVEAGGIVARRFAEPEPEAPPAPKPVPEWMPPPETVPPAASQAAPATPEPRSKPAPEPAVVVKPEQRADPEPVPDDEPESIAELLSLLQAEPEPQPPSEPSLQPDEPASGGDGADEKGDADIAADLEASQPPLSGGKRLSDRIRQVAPETETVATSQVPLRTTWKSRSDAAASASSKPKPQTPPTPRKDVQKVPPAPRARAPEVRTDVADAAPAGEGLDDKAIAAILAAAAVAPTGEPRVPRDRAAARDTDGSAAGPATRATLFGARVPVAEAITPEPEPDLPDPTPEAAPEMPGPEAPEIAVPAAAKARPETRPPTPAPKAPVTAPRVSAAPEDLASPRVAVLRERRPDPASAERRERPRIAARAVPAPAAPVVGPTPIPASEHGILDRAIALIVSRSAELEGMIDPDEKLPVDMILDHGKETTEQVIEVLSEASSAELRRINGDLSEVQDLIMLMQLEKGHAPADDAMTLILQIRRDLETLRAA